MQDIDIVIIGAGVAGLTAAMVAVNPATPAPTIAISMSCMTGS